MLRRSLAKSLLSLGALVSTACGAAPPSSPIALRDPLGLMDVTGELRLVVFPSTERSCESDGALTPALPDDPATPLPTATVDSRFAATDLEQTVQVEAGSYVIAVQGWGTDPVTLRTGVLVTQGCATGAIESGQQRDITLTLQDVEGMGLCGDGVLSPDEQCEMATGPFPCDATSCRTLEAVANTELGGKTAPAVDWRLDGRVIIGFQNGATEQGLSFLSETAQRIDSPAALAVDGAVGSLPGVQTGLDVAGSAARVAVAVQYIGTSATEGGDAYVRFYSVDRAPQGALTLLVPSTGAQTRPRLAMVQDGSTMVVFNDQESTSGATAAFVPAGATTPSTTFPLGSAGAASPAIASSGSQLIATWVEGGAVRAQRFGADGSAIDAAPIEVSDSDGPGVPTAALLADGRAYIAWTVGSGVRGRAIDGSGTVGEALDLTGAGTKPRVAAGSGRFFVVWDGGGTVMARYLDGNGAPAPNHEQPRSDGAFAIGAGASPDVAGGGTGSPAAAVVTWESGGNVAYRTFPLP